MKRLIIYPKDIQQITGRSERYGRDIIRQIKLQTNKKPFQLVTFKEFSEFMDIPLEEIYALLGYMT